MDRSDLMRWIGAAAIGSLAVAAVFWTLRHHHTSRLMTWARAKLASLPGIAGQEGLANVVQSLQKVYAQRWYLWPAILLHLAAWFAGSLQIWAAGHYLNMPMDLVDALVMDSLVHAVRAAFVLVPLGAPVSKRGPLSWRGQPLASMLRAQSPCRSSSEAGIWLSEPQRSWPGDCWSGGTPLQEPVSMQPRGIRRG